MQAKNEGDYMIRVSKAIDLSKEITTIGLETIKTVSEKIMMLQIDEVRRMIIAEEAKDGGREETKPDDIDNLNRNIQNEDIEGFSRRASNQVPSTSRAHKFST